MDLPTAGFWGPPTSTVDWCEANYRLTPYLAEPFNALSSLAMVAVGLAGILLHRRLALRFLWAFGLVALVGAGSVAFHATLRFGLQMMDELPMLYLVLLMVYVLVEDGPRPRLGTWFPAVLFGCALFLTGLTVLNRGRLQFILFQLGFGSLELYSLVRVWLLQRRSTNPTLRRIYRIGMASYAGAVVAWFIDLKACPWLHPNPQLHAAWHLGVSVGFYLLLIVIAMHRLETLGVRAFLRWRAGFVPQIVEPTPALFTG